MIFKKLNALPVSLGQRIVPGHKLWVPSSLEMIEKLESEYPRDFKFDKRKEILERRDKIINFYLTKISDHIRSSS